MTRWSVFVSMPLPDYVRQDISEAFDAHFNEKLEPLPQEELIRHTQGRDALLTWVGDRIDGHCIDRLPSSLKAIATYSVGYDHVDLQRAKARGVAVLNTPDVLTDSVAEAAMLFALATARRVTESADLVRGHWPGYTLVQLIGFELARKTMGIFGMGRIGRAIAERARAFRMNISYSDVKRLPAELEMGAKFCTSEALLRESDVVVLACNSTPETRGFINRDRLALMKKTGIVINISRGDIVVDDALIEALERGTIFGAGLDVFNNEPAIDPRYRKLPNAFIMPHIGSSTVEARRRMGQILIDGLQALKVGRPVPNRLA